MAKGEPPHSDLHPMRALFLIPKKESPALEGNFSKSFKGCSSFRSLTHYSSEFVTLCLNKDPKERPTAKDLLKHPFINRAKATSALTGNSFHSFTATEQLDRTC